MKLVVDEAAAADVERIFAYVAERNPRAARKVVERIRHAITVTITSFPYLGRFGRSL